VSVHTIRVSRGHDPQTAFSRRRPIPLVPGEFAMTAFARESGARAFTVVDVASLADTSASIAEELASQYVLGYLRGPATADRSWHQVAVRVPGHPHVVARTRPGYAAGRASRLAWSS
jgi:hypothetical protein